MNDGVPRLSLYWRLGVTTVDPAVAFHRLSEGGYVLIPVAKYGFSTRTSGPRLVPIVVRDHDEAMGFSVDLLEPKNGGSAE